MRNTDDRPLATDIGNLSMTLADARTAHDVAAVIGKIVKRAEEAVGAAMTTADKNTVACRAGCSACCAMNVAVLFPEAIAIASYLADNMPAARLPRLKAVLGETAEKVRWMEDDERRRLRIRCPFLDTRGYCIIHPARPLVCRSITSTDPELCRQAMDADPDEPVTVVMNLAQKFLFDSAFRTLGDSLEKLALESRSYEVSRAVWQCLVNPCITHRFLSGEKISLP